MSSEKTITSLYNLTDEVFALDEMLETIQTSEDSQVAIDLQNEVFELVQKKADNCVKYDKYLGTTIDAIDAEIERLKKMKKTAENKQSSFRKYLVFCIQKMGVSKLQGATYSMTVRKGLPKLAIHDETMIPAQFVVVKQETVIDKKALLQALKEDTENAIMGASVIESEPSLLIK